MTSLHVRVHGRGGADAAQHIHGGLRVERGNPHSMYGCVGAARRMRRGTSSFRPSRLGTSRRGSSLDTLSGRASRMRAARSRSERSG